MNRRLFTFLFLGVAFLGVVLEAPIAYGESPGLRLYTYPDRFPLTAQRESRSVFVMATGGLDTSGVSGRLSANGIESNVNLDDEPIHIEAGSGTPLEISYRLSAEIGGKRYVSNRLIIEWREKKPSGAQLGDFLAFLDGLPGGASFAALALSLGFAGVTIFATRSGLAGSVVFYAVFGVLAVITPVNPVMWILVLLSSLGTLGVAVALGYKTA